MDPALHQQLSTPGPSVASHAQQGVPLLESAKLSHNDSSNDGNISSEDGGARGGNITRIPQKAIRRRRTVTKVTRTSTVTVTKKKKKKENNGMKRKDDKDGRKGDIRRTTPLPVARPAAAAASRSHLPVQPPGACLYVRPIHVSLSSSYNTHVERISHRSNPSQSDTTLLGTNPPVHRVVGAIPSVTVTRTRAEELRGRVLRVEGDLRYLDEKREVMRRELLRCWGKLKSECESTGGTQWIAEDAHLWDVVRKYEGGYG